MFVLLPGRARVDLRLERLGLEGGHYKQHQSQTRGKIRWNTYFPSTEKGPNRPFKQTKQAYLLLDTVQ